MLYFVSTISPQLDTLKSNLFIVKIKLPTDNVNIPSTGIITDQASIEAIKRIKNGKPRFQVILLGGQKTHPSNWACAFVIGGITVSSQNLSYQPSGQIEAIGYSTASDKMFVVGLNASGQYKLVQIHNGLKI